MDSTIEFNSVIDPSQTSISVKVDGLVCSSSCTPVGDTLTAKFAGFYTATESSSKPSPTGQNTVKSLRPDKTHAVWSASLQPSTVKPGETATLTLKAETDPGYHIYRYVPGDKETSFRTLIITDNKSGLKFGEPRTDTPIEVSEFLEDVQYYSGPVTWQIPVQVPTSMKAGEAPIKLQVGFYTCDDNSCDSPAGVAFSGSLTVAGTASPTAISLAVAQVDYARVADLMSSVADVVPEQKIESPAQTLTLFHVLAGLAGGFILNFMPCVLPVIGLKVMSFVNQAGNDHRRVVGLNLAFVGGILAVMLALALITVAAKIIWGTAFGWGEQFTVLEFKVILAALVFAMALSFLGVWEIPIPGFATSKKSGELMEAEGHWGAFNKGVLTTVLATPCSGPLLGSLFGLSLTLSPFSVVLLYLIVGLGMSLPYLALCLYPGAIKLLPKPGPWMETLKQLLAFPLLLTVVFFVASIDNGHRIATLILLIVVWFACWIIGRVPAYAEPNRVRTAWLGSTVSVALGAYISFAYFGPINSDLPWVPYNAAQLAQYRQEGKTVMIDFTANWCLNCQINTRVAIEQPEVAKLVAANNVVAMLADWTEPSEEIKQKLDELESNSIPLMAIYPPELGAEPILLRDLLTQSQVVAALKEAGPSQSRREQARTTLTSRVQ